MTPTLTLIHQTGSLAYDDTGGEGPLMVLLPGAGDVRSEHRFLAERLRAAGHRVVTMDLRGHGDSSAAWPSYGVEESAGDIVALLRTLDAGPAVLVANSFAPAAALWAAAEVPELISGVVALSPHLSAGGTAIQEASLRTMLRGPWAGWLWGKLYRGWYKTTPPEDLDREIERLRSMMADPDRRKAVRETLLAHRDGLDEKIASLDLPVLAVFGTEDDHFPDPESEAKRVADATDGSYVMVVGAGHYPHVEQPGAVADAIADFMAARR